MDPLELLPPEMWAEIFVRVKGATDWHNLHNASPSFHNAAKSQRVTVLFPLVLPHLTKYLIKDDEDLKTLLPLRHVSHKWRQGVDSLIETELKEGKTCYSVLNYSFAPHRSKVRFLEKFENHPTSPFIGSAIYLDPPHSPLNPSFMHKFGVHLKGLQLNSFGKDNDMLLRVGQVLKLCPNLEYLKIGCGPWGFGSLVVQRLSAEAEFPMLPKLKSLLIAAPLMEWSTRQQVCNSLLRVCCNPDSLTEATVDFVPSELSTMPNLKSLALYDTTVEGLSGLRNASWPLTQLTMDRYCSGEDLDLDMRSVFRAAERFGETLTTLTLKIRFHTPDTTEPLALPRLKYLRMTAPGNSISCLDFLVNLSKLEEFHLEGWTGRMRETRMQEGHIKVPFSGTKINMLESNIWEVLPRLRKLFFSGGGELQSRPTHGFVRRGDFYSRGMGSTPL